MLGDEFSVSLTLFAHSDIGLGHFYQKRLRLLRNTTVDGHKPPQLTRIAQRISVYHQEVRIVPDRYTPNILLLS
jgi:hypothetical protein